MFFFGEQTSPEKEGNEQDTMFVLFVNKVQTIENCPRCSQTIIIWKP